MPYIPKSDRDRAIDMPEIAGELNFCITNVIMDYLENPNIPGNRVITYQALNEIIGALECVKQEFYRRVVVPYEDQKRLDNGDVYGER